jgi:biotin synthase
MAEIRNDWTRAEIAEIYNRPLMDLVYQAAGVHRQWHDHRKVQIASLLSVKTGGCSEDCGYCPQAARYHTGVKAHKLLSVDEVVTSATKARDGGASRFCMGAAWREVRDNRDFDKVLDMVKTVNGMGMEVCCTMGMLTTEQAEKLKEAGLHAYNHNIDTSEEFYSEVITTRQYEDRLNTLHNVRHAGISVCSGGIIGMGETTEDRIGLLLTLATLETHPESVPINKLVPVAGTPMEDNLETPMEEMVRMVATARLVMPGSMIRLSAGRASMSHAEQFLCFMAGANSIHSGEKLLTTPTANFEDDAAMLQAFGLLPLKAGERTANQVTAEVC